MGQRCCIERGEAARAAPSASVSYYNIAQDDPWGPPCAEQHDSNDGCRCYFTSTSDFVAVKSPAFIVYK